MRSIATTAIRRATRITCVSYSCVARTDETGNRSPTQMRRRSERSPMSLPHPLQRRTLREMTLLRAIVNQPVRTTKDLVDALMRSVATTAIRRATRITCVSYSCVARTDETRNRSPMQMRRRSERSPMSLPHPLTTAHLEGDDPAQSNCQPTRTYNQRPTSGGFDEIRCHNCDQKGHPYHLCKLLLCSPYR